MSRQPIQRKKSIALFALCLSILGTNPGYGAVKAANKPSPVTTPKPSLDSTPKREVPPIQKGLVAPVPAPGPVPQPAALSLSSSGPVKANTDTGQGIIKTLLESPLATKVEVAIANKATSTPTLLVGPVEAIKLSGGVSEIIPNAIILGKIYGPLLVAAVINYSPIAAATS